MVLHKISALIKRKKKKIQTSFGDYFPAKATVKRVPADLSDVFSPSFLEEASPLPIGLKIADNHSE